MVSRTPDVAFLTAFASFLVNAHLLKMKINPSSVSAFLRLQLKPRIALNLKGNPFRFAFSPAATKNYLAKKCIP